MRLLHAFLAFVVLALSVLVPIHAFADVMTPLVGSVPSESSLLAGLFKVVFTVFTVLVFGIILLFTIHVFTGRTIEVRDKSNPDQFVTLFPTARHTNAMLCFQSGMFLAMLGFLFVLPGGASALPFIVAFGALIGVTGYFVGYAKTA